MFHIGDKLLRQLDSSYLQLLEKLFQSTPGVSMTGMRALVLTFMTCKLAGNRKPWPVSLVAKIGREEDFDALFSTRSVQNPLTQHDEMWHRPLPELYNMLNAAMIW
jgi:hypothetical protein